MKKILAVGVSAILLLSLWGCSSPGNESSDGSATGTSSVQSVAPSSSDKRAFAKGETAEQDGIRVTLTDVIESTGEDAFMKPAEGKIFLLCQFEIDNQSEKDFAVSSMVSFDCYLDSVQTNLSIGALAMASRNDLTQLDGSVAAGKKMLGVVGYEAPSDWKELEIQFKPAAWRSNKIIFKYQK